MTAPHTQARVWLPKSKQCACGQKHPATYSADLIKRWIAERVDIVQVPHLEDDPDALPSENAYVDYVIWCAVHGCTPLTEYVFDKIADGLHQAL